MVKRATRRIVGLCEYVVMKCWVGFSRHNSFVSRLIAAKLGKPYSHVFMLFDCNGETLVLQATGRGINALSWDVFKSSNCVIEILEVKDEEKAAKAFKYCISKLGRPYGFLAIIAIGLGLHYSDGEKTLICSEYVTRALDLKFNKDEDLVTPADVRGQV
jgi:uncharacterized protein YycO